jgi:plastocyanin
MSKEQSKTTVLAVGAALVIAVLGIGTAVYALTLDTSESKTQVSETSGHSHTSDDKKASAPSTEKASLVITYGNDGFEQASYTVKSGETVLVENASKEEFYFTTGDHHNHDIHSPLNLGTIAPGESSSFVAPEAKTYGFHNHDNETEAGTLIVQ